MLSLCTGTEHVYSGWILGTRCQCGATEVRFHPETGAVRADPLEAPPPEVEAVAVGGADTLDAELAADAKQAEGEADAEATEALRHPRRRR